MTDHLAIVRGWATWPTDLGPGGPGERVEPGRPTLEAIASALLDGRTVLLCASSGHILVRIRLDQQPAIAIRGDVSDLEEGQGLAIWLGEELPAAMRAELLMRRMRGES